MQGDRWGSLVKNPPATEKARVRTLSWENPLEKEMATHSCILAWRIPWTEEPGGLWFMGSQRVGHDSVTKQQQGKIVSGHRGNAGCRQVMGS